MEITEKFNLKSKALIIILITLLITGISTMSYAAMPRFPNFAGLGGSNITQMFKETFGNLVQRGMDYMAQLKKAGSDIDFDGGRLVIAIKDGQNINFNAAIGLMETEEGEKTFGAEVKELELKVGEMTLVGMKDARGNVSFNLEDGIVVNANTGEGIKLINDKVVIDAEALANAKIEKNYDGTISLIAGAGGVVTIGKDGEEPLASFAGDGEGNVTVNIPAGTVKADVNAQQTVAVEGVIEETITEEVHMDEYTNLDVMVNDKPIFSKNLRDLFGGIMERLSGLRAGFGAMFNR
jgi:hypothetical protein